MVERFEQARVHRRSSPAAVDEFGELSADYSKITVEIK
jgi:hypothetical protein